MSKKKAFVRYANNKLVPASVFIGAKAPAVGVWKEIPYDLCCDGGGGGNCLIEAELYYADNGNQLCTGTGLGPQTYFISYNNNSFFPSIYLDANGTTLAPAGFYSYTNGGPSPTILFVDPGVDAFLTGCA